MRTRILLWAGMAMAAVVFSGCARGPMRPVLYPNDHLSKVGQAAADADIDLCMQMAKDSGTDTGRGKKVAKDTARAAAVGGASGAAAGAFSRSESAGSGAKAGAAGAAAGTLVSSTLNSREPDPVFKRFVEQCLRDKGYQVVGWK